jgi:PAS domain S-box-containing protein
MALSEDITERKRAEEALQRSEAYLAEGQRLAKMGSWAVNPKTDTCIYWSEEMRQIFGLDPQRRNLPDREEFLRLVHPEDRPGFNERVDQGLRAKADIVQDYRIVLPDGTIKHIHAIGHPVLDETGNIIEYVGTDLDVTEQREASAALQNAFEQIKAEQTELRWMTDAIATYIYVLSPDGKPLYANQTVLDYTGLTSEDLQKEDHRARILHPEDVERFREERREALARGVPFENEQRGLGKDGKYRWFLVRYNPLRDDQGRIIRWYATGTDIDDRKRAEEALRRSERYLAEAQRLSHTGSWAWNVRTGSLFWSQEIFRIYDYPFQETGPTWPQFLERVHPEDRPQIERRAKIEASGKEWVDPQNDFRLVLPDGTIKHLHSVAHPVRDDSGEITEVVGTVMDVTQQHEARAALQRAFEQIKAEETELRRMIDAIPISVSVLRPDGRVIYVNQTAVDYAGVTVEEAREGHRDPRHPEDVERLREERLKALAGDVPFEDELRVLGKDGKYRWFLVRYNPLRDDQGRVIRWYATGTDIDDRKRAEERMRNENLALREQIDQAFMFEEIVGSSPALQTVLSGLVKVARTDSTVLITGETGTGKELIARAIHKHSQRSGQPFISVNCASIPSSLIASELFGHEKGAFTGAVQRRQGRFELAHCGTIFLDEVGDLPLETQVTLLRVLQERQFERVGGNRILTTDVRVIAATNRDLTAGIAAGTFRPDLFYRLNVFPIEVPPLRKRKEDIPILVEYFVKRYAEKAGKQIRKIDKNTLELCQSYSWPGNIRELQNLVERSVILSSGDTFQIEKAWLASPEPTRQELPNPLPDALQNQERKMIETALAECNGKVAGPQGAAAKLGIPRSTLDWKIKQLNIKKHKFIPGY